MILKILKIISLIAVFLYTFLSLVKIITTSAPDFSVYYDSAANLIAHKNIYLDQTLYTGLGYPPFSVLFFLPFAILPYKFSQGIWIILSVVLIGVIVYESISLSNIETKIESYLIWLSLVLLFFPTKFTLGMGQSNIVALFFLLTAVYLESKNKNGKSGWVYGISMIIKPHLILLLPFFIIYRKYRFSAFAIFMVLISIIITGYFFGWELYQDYWTTTAFPLLSFQGRDIYYNQNIAGFFSRIRNFSLAPQFTVIFSMIAYCLSCYMAFKNTSDFKKLIIFAIPVFLLIEPLAWQHHFVFLIPVYIILWPAITKSWMQILYVISFCLVGFNLKNPELFYLIPGGNLILSHVFIGLCIIYLLIWDKFYRKI
jgi:hypothetical protein